MARLKVIIIWQHNSDGEKLEFTTTANRYDDVNDNIMIMKIITLIGSLLAKLGGIINSLLRNETITHIIIYFVSTDIRLYVRKYQNSIVYAFTRKKKNEKREEGYFFPTVHPLFLQPQNYVHSKRKIISEKYIR